MVTHTADCSTCDFRLNKVPASDWEKGQLRPLYLYRGEYPSTISKARGVTWHPDNLEGTAEQLAAWGEESTLTGFVPQVEHTYALIEAGYGIQNEHGVAVGESTCAARFVSAPTSAGGAARIEVREMSRIALERSKTAREAIQIMGNLATELGFYGADWSGGDASLGEAGEALTVIDPNEAWVFHVLADDTGTAAIWVMSYVLY
jgi:dipeptidase